MSDKSLSERLRDKAREQLKNVFAFAWGCIIWPIFLVGAIVTNLGGPHNRRKRAKEIVG